MFANGAVYKNPCDLYNTNINIFGGFIIQNAEYIPWVWMILALFSKWNDGIVCILSLTLTSSQWKLFYIEYAMSILENPH